MTPSEVIAIYNDVITRKGLERVFRTGGTVFEDAQRFLDWCRRRDVDPERYIRARHEAVHWKHRIPFRTLGSEKFLAKFRAWGDQHQHGEQFQDYLHDDLHTTRSNEILAEAIRRTTVTPIACYADPVTWYDSRSSVCPTCPEMERCRAGSE